MKILFSLNSFYPPFDHHKSIGGGEKSAYELLKMLSKNNKVTVICANDEIEKGMYYKKNCKIINIPIPWFKGLGLWNSIIRDKIWYFILNYKIDINKYDLVITQGQFISSTINISSSKNIKSVLFIRAYENFKKINKFCNTNYSVINYIKLLMNVSARNIHYKINRSAIKSASNVIVNSYFMKDIVDEEYDINSRVIYPFINLKRYKPVINNKKYILFINPTYKKGVEIFIKIANSMPHLNFLCAGSAIEKYKEILESLPNVTYLGWIENIGELYKKSSLLLVPSVWDEPFGRIAVEAMINGIPVIASKKGGLNEIVKDSGILIEDLHDVELWRKSIEEILNNKELYQEKSEKSEIKAEYYNIDKGFNDFNKKILNL